MNKVKFFRCQHCGNLMYAAEDSGVPMICCGEKMQELVANTVEASVEKHLPVVSVNGNEVIVKIGSVDHPMIETHLINWVYLETNEGGQIKYLSPDVEPAVGFTLNFGETAVAAYAYCNLHGLWKTEIEAVEPEASCPVEEVPVSENENYVVCNCNNVRFADIEVALHSNKRFADVLAAFDKVKDTTHCSTGCGGCHDKVMNIISDLMMGHR